MQDLNKHQIVLLCILISFIVSIATGIMTTSLLMQAPVELTKTVNQVVEKTIQTVTPEPTATNPNPTPKQVETVVVNEDDSVTNAIAQNAPSIVRIREKNADGTIDNLYSLGMIVSKDGIIVADKQSLSSVMTYSAVMSDGTLIPLVPIDGDKDWQVTFFKAKPTKSYTFTPVNLSPTNLKLGQTIISIGGDSVNAVLVGRVISLNMKDLPNQLGTSTPVQYVSSIEGDISPADNVSGAPIVSLSGDVVGMSLASFSSPKSYLPSAIIAQEESAIVVAK